MKKILLISLVGMAVLITGCETTSSQPYKASTKNVIAFQKTLKNTGKKVNVGNFSAAPGVDTELTCRAMGAIEVAPGKDAVTFISDAIQEELFAADVYDSAGTVITGSITEFEADSWGEGQWDIGLNLSSPNLPNGLDVRTTYTFKSSFSALSACQNVVDAFTPAVQTLIGEAVDHPDFTKLAG